MLVLPSSPPGTPTNRTVGVWSSQEHDRFLDALKLFPQGPWKTITEFVGTRSVRQVQTHAQKYQEKVSRRLHGLQMGKAIRLRREHRIDHDVLALRTLIRLPPRSKHPSISAEPSPSLHWMAKPEWHGASSSLALSSLTYDTFDTPHVKDDELPTLSESLDFFIENLA